MEKQHIRIFRLALLPLALTLALPAFADNSELETVNVQGKSSARAPVTSKTIARSTAVSLRDTLRDETGVQFGGGQGSTSQWVSIRGVAEDQIDIVVDNANAGDTPVFHHQSRMALDPALVKIIGVDKGTGSASAGIGATSGRIRATTLDAADLLKPGRNVGARINGGVYSNTGFTAGITGYARFDALDLLAGINFTRQGDYKDGKGNKIKGTEADSKGYLAKIGYHFDEANRVVLSHRREEVDGDRALRNEFANQPPMRTDFTQDTTNLEYFGRLPFAREIEANIFRSRITDDKQPLNPNAPVPPGVPPIMSGKVPMYGAIRTTGANFGLSSDIGSLLTLKYGINWRSIAAHNAASSSQKKTDSGVYLEGIWQLSPVTLTTGLRYDRFRYTPEKGAARSSGRFNPSIGAVWDISPAFSLNASYNTASRSPRLQEAMLALGNTRLAENIKAAHARTAEAGFKFRHAGFAVSGSLYRQTVKDYIAPINYVLTNSGKFTNTGYEITAAYRWQGLHARAGMSYSTPRLNGKIADNAALAFPMGRQYHAGLSYKFARPQLEIGWRGRFAQARGWCCTTNRTRQTLSPHRAGYGVHDLYASWQPLADDSLNVNFSINNVGNKQYYSHSERDAAISGGNALPESGRDVRLAVNYRF